MIKKNRPSVCWGLIAMDLKNKIIHSAYGLFAAKGYEKATIGEIIEQAECSKGGFYHHFKSKEDILEVIIENYIDELSKYFAHIVTNDEDSFIDRFNTIFMSVSHYKLKQLVEWSKVSNVFSFAGNDRILRQLEKQFKIATTKVYLEVLQLGKAQGIIDIEYPEIFAELCTREILWIYEAAGKLIGTDEPKEQDMFEKLLDFSEELISHALGLKGYEVRFKEEAFLYLQKAREYYFANREE